MGPFPFRVPTAANVVEDYAHANTVFHQAICGLRYTMRQWSATVKFFESGGQQARIRRQRRPT